LPTSFSSLVMVVGMGLCSCFGLLKFRCGADRVDDVLVAGAAAEVAVEAVADFVVCRVRVALDDLFGNHDHAGGAEAALEGVLGPESFLHGVELAFGGGEAFDGEDACAIGLDGKHAAAFDGFAVEFDGAGSAEAGLAAHVGTGEAEDFAEVVDEEQTRFDFVGVRHAVDGYVDGSVHEEAPGKYIGFGAENGMEMGSCQRNVRSS
jgi:hypothetical protein